jgi:ubiquinone/menaquinone biosynthesis C-methylase UbiE
MTAELQEQIDARFAAEASHWSEIYHETSSESLVYRERHHTALEWMKALRLPADTRLLEVGCGVGLFAVEAARMGFRVDAVDRVTEMVDAARTNALNTKTGDRVTVQLADASAVPFEDATFAAVVALGLLPWLTDRDETLRELVRVLAPGGFLLTSADNRYGLERWLDPARTPLVGPFKAATIQHMANRGRARRNVNGPTQAPFSAPGLRRCLHQAGLEPVRATTFGLAQLTFMRRSVGPENGSSSLQRRLTGLIDRGGPVARRLGSQHLVLARKPGRAA